MKNRDLSWLKKKIEVLGAFDGSFLKYVDSSKEMKKATEKLEISPSKVLKLDSNENFFVNLSDLNVMLQEVVQDLDLRVYDARGVWDVKKAVGKYVNAPPESIIVGSGSEQLIDLVVDLFVEKGDNVVSIEPSFFVYQKRVSLQGASFFGVPLNNDLSIDRKSILEKSTSRTRLLFICSPNNPTGNEFDSEELESLADESSAIIVVDEAYAEFGDCSSVPLAVKKENVIVLRTFSKAFGLAGLRFGYAVTNPNLASTLSNTLPYTVNTITSKFVVKLLENVDMIKECARMIRDERERLIGGLRSIGGVRVFDSKANFVTFNPHKDVDRICERLLEEGIIVKNLGELPVIGDCLRVTVGLPYMNDQFLNALRLILKER
jgi:histidinol-phosphate aminotransferase